MDGTPIADRITIMASAEQAAALERLGARSGLEQKVEITPYSADGFLAGRSTSPN